MTGVDEVDLFETIRFTMPVVEANPETASDVEDCVPMMRGVPPSDAVDCAVKPVPVIVAVRAKRKCRRIKGLDHRRRALQRDDRGTRSTRPHRRNSICTGSVPNPPPRSTMLHSKPKTAEFHRAQRSPSAAKFIKGGTSVTVAVLFSPAPVAVIVSVPLEVNVAGAV